MGFEKITGNNNFIVWIIIFIVALGFGKCGSAFGINVFTPPVNNDCDNDHKSRKHCKEVYGRPAGVPPFGIPAPAGFVRPGGIGGLFGGNALFVIVIIALLFLCKDGVPTATNNTVVNIDPDDEINEYQD